MRLRVGFITGFALGYYLGAMAGRERYEQINKLLRQAQDSDALEGAAGKARAVVDLGRERARDLVGSKATDGANSNESDSQL
jgi:hypothetical protein